MPLTSTNFAGSASGWTNSGNVFAFDGVYATANCTRIFEPDPSPHYIAPPTASLLCGTFGLSIGAGDTVNGIEVEIRVMHDGGIPSDLQGVIWLARGGVQVGSAKIFAATTSLTSVVLGGAADTWGGSWNGTDLAGLQVVLYLQGTSGTGTSVVSIDGVRANATYTGSTPNPFTFTDVTGATQSTLYTSDSITITGITSSVPVTISGGEYEKNNSGVWTSSAGTANNGDTFRVRITSSAAANTAVNSTLTVGGVSDTYTVTTAAVDTTPDAFGWSTVYGVNPSTVNDSSDSVMVTGINSAAAITVASGYYSKNGGAWTNAAGTVVAGDFVRARVTASGSYSTSTAVTVTIGGVAGTFTVVTRAADTTPNAFTFTDVAGATTSTVYTSNTITVAGIEAAAALSFVTSGGSVHEYKINSGAWTAVGATTINNGDQLTVRMTSPGGANQAGNIAVTIGGVQDTYTVATGADTVPDQFTFTDQTNAIPSVVYESNQVTIAGMTAAVAVTGSVVGGEFKINAGGWVTTGDVVNGDQITVRGTAPAIPGSTQSVVFTLGGVSDTFSITSRAAVAQDF